MNIKSKMTDMYYARKNILKSLNNLFCSITISIAIFIGIEIILINDPTFELIIEKSTLFSLLIILVSISVIEILWNFFKYRKCVFVKHNEIENSHCKCSASTRPVLLLCTSHNSIPETNIYNRLEITCPKCQKLIYHCTIEDNDENFDADII